MTIAKTIQVYLYKNKNKNKNYLRILDYMTH